MNIAAYCRVSTDKEDQLNSLETQKKFFVEYAEKNGHTLVRLYADEGLSGTKVKHRREFQRMMADAELGMFDQLVGKDISRLARNTVDLLQSVRRLKALGIQTQFLTANMGSMGDSEFVLTVFAGLAQEESANMSKRVKFEKRVNAERGKVPNLVYRYDKTIGDYFHLPINPEEAAVVRKIYDWYIQDGFGAGKIAAVLNQQGARTKRGREWSQNGVCSILSNPIYVGKIINGKQEIRDCRITVSLSSPSRFAAFRGGNMFLLSAETPSFSPAWSQSSYRSCGKKRGVSPVFAAPPNKLPKFFLFQKRSTNSDRIFPKYCV